MCIHTHTRTFIYMNMSSMNRDCFTCSFSIGMPFIYLPCLFGLTRTLSTMLHRSVKNNTLVFFPMLGAKHPVFHHYEWCYLWVFHRCSSSGWRSSLLFLFCWVYFHETVLDFVRCFPSPYIYELIMRSPISLHSINIVYYINWFSYVILIVTVYSEWSMNFLLKA